MATKTTIIITIIIALIIIIPCVKANIIISQVLPNPADGIEIIELQNTGNEAINITGWTIETERSVKDATLKGTITAGERFIIADTGYNTSDYAETITLSDTDSGIALRNNNNDIIDAVGWGNPDNINEWLYETTPADNPKKGTALLRIRDTNNNKDDFITTTPDFNKGIDAIIEITNTSTQSVNLTISNANIPDDNPTMQGIQWNIVPGETRNIKINTTKQVVWQNITYQSQNNQIIIPLKYTTIAGNYDLTIENSITTISIPAKSALKTIGIINATSPAGTDAMSALRIENIGNTEITPKADTAKLHNENNEINPKIRIQSAKIKVGETKDINIIISLPYAEEGTYRGRIRILAE